MEPDLEQRIDLYVRGELSPAEARELAQEALRPDLLVPSFARRARQVDMRGVERPICEHDLVATARY